MGQVIALRTRNLISRSHPAFVAYTPPGGLGALGVTPSTSAVGAGASIGTAILPGVGTAIGAIIGLVAGSLLNKNYLNVAQANAGEDQAVQAFNQYRTIQGTVAGRQLGVPAMTAIFDGAVYSGVFPLNNQQKTFHEGALKYPGNPDWVWGIMNDGANNPYTFAWAMQQYAAVRSQNSGGVPDAVLMVDQFFIPSNTRDSPAWAVPSNAVAHQLLYDAADAYLAAHAGFTTTPFVASTWNANQIAAASAPTQVQPAASSTTLPYVVPTSASTIGQPWLPIGEFNTPLQRLPVTVSGRGSCPTCTPYPPGTAMPAIACVPPGMLCQEGCRMPCGAGSQVLNPIATPIMAPQQPPVNSPPGVVTSTIAATNANLDANMAAQGFVRVGTTPAGFPLYSSAGQVYAYQNGQLYPFGSVAQLAATGNAGSGASVPGTGLDPNTLAAIQAAVAQGVAPLAAAQGAALNLQSQGVPITPTVAGQIADAANAAGAAPVGGISPMMLLGGGLLLILLLRRRA